MTLWSSTLEKLLSFSINLFARQLYPPQSSHWIQFPWRQQIPVCAIFLQRRWTTWHWDVRCAHAILQRAAKSSAAVTSVFPLDHFHRTFAFMNLAMFRTPVANAVCELWNDTEIKGETTSAQMCKQQQQQLRSPTWTEKQKGKMKNRSLNSRLAVMFLMNHRVPDAEELTAVLKSDGLARAYWRSGFLLRWSLQIPDLFD